MVLQTNSYLTFHRLQVRAHTLPLGSHDPARPINRKHHFQILSQIIKQNFGSQKCTPRFFPCVVISCDGGFPLPLAYLSVTTYVYIHYSTTRYITGVSSLAHILYCVYLNYTSTTTLITCIFVRQSRSFQGFRVICNISLLLNQWHPPPSPQSSKSQHNFRTQK